MADDLGLKIGLEGEKAFSGSHKPKHIYCIDDVIPEGIGFHYADNGIIVELFVYGLLISCRYYAIMKQEVKEAVV